MRFFLDTADVGAVREAASTGLVDGITTNPSLISKSGCSGYREVIHALRELVNGDISVEVISEDLDGMVRDGREIAKIADNLVVKLPTNINGVTACKILSDSGIKVNMTLCFSIAQAIVVAKAGASFVSLFVGRLEDKGNDGISLVKDIRKIYDEFGYCTSILVASVRNVRHVVEAAKLKADVVTLPLKVFWQMFGHSMTDEGLKIFSDDWNRSKCLYL